MKKKSKKISFEDLYVKANRKAQREIELERNGGRWIAVDRPHKNKKKYDRKRDKKFNVLIPFSFIMFVANYFPMKKFYSAGLLYLIAMMIWMTAMII